jgi:hypothetical protein
VAKILGENISKPNYNDSVNLIEEQKMAGSPTKRWKERNCLSELKANYRECCVGEISEYH